jgi:hypothetical protein
MKVQQMSTSTPPSAKSNYNAYKLSQQSTILNAPKTNKIHNHVLTKEQYKKLKQKTKEVSNLLKNEQK